MQPNIATIANAFYVVAALLGLPSLATTLLYGVVRLKVWLAPVPAGSSFEQVKNPDAILLLLGGMTRTVSAVASLVGGLSQWLLGVLAVAGSVVLVLAVAFFVTGRGLHAQQDWARVVGLVLMGALLLVSMASCVAFRGVLAVMGLGLVVASGYALLGLSRGFAV